MIAHDHLIIAKFWSNKNDEYSEWASKRVLNAID